MYKSDRRRQDVDAHRPRRHAAHRARHRGPARPERRVRRGARPHLRPERRARRLPLARRRRARGRRCSTRTRTPARSTWQFDPKNPKIVYAALWQHAASAVERLPAVERPGQRRCSSRPTAATTWTPLDGDGLPTEGLGRIGIAVAPTNGRRVYAIVDAKQGGLYRSDDAGATWTQVSSDQRVWGRGWYFGELTVDPTNPDRVYVAEHLALPLGRRRQDLDGHQGRARRRRLPGLWIYPTDPNRLIIASDQGAIVSVDGAQTWSSWYNQPTAQFYHVATDYRFPYWVYGAQQDSGAVAVASRSHYGDDHRRATGVRRRAGGEAGYIAPDPLRPRHPLRRPRRRGCDVADRQDRTNVSPDARDLPEPYRAHLDAAARLLAGATRTSSTSATSSLFRTDNGGEQLDARSAPTSRARTRACRPTSTRPPRPTRPRGTAPRRHLHHRALAAPRARRSGSGTDDGLIQLTTDEGKTWRTSRRPRSRRGAKVGIIEASHFDANDRVRGRRPAPPRRLRALHLPHPRRRQDLAGRSRPGIPDGVYVQRRARGPRRNGPAVSPARRRAVYVSFDDGDHWQSLQLNLPPASMRDLDVHGDDLVVATHGRGFWILDDVTPLRQITGDVASAGVHLFHPAPAIATPPPNEGGTPQPRDEPFAENPPYGACIDYYLKADAAGPVTLDILDPAGEVIRSYSSDEHPTPVNPDTLNIPAFWRPLPPALSAKAGMHRWVWDLRPTAPPRRGGGFFRGVPVVLPGTYTARLTVAGRSYTQPIVVERDPRE